MSDAPREPARVRADPELQATVEALLAEPEAWTSTEAERLPGREALRARLQTRAQASADASRAMHHARLRDMPAAAPELDAGLRTQWLYLAPEGGPRRPGEPLRVRLMHLAAGAEASVGPDPGGALLELLVLQGQVDATALQPDADGPLQALDFAVAMVPPRPLGLRAGPEGALLYLREVPRPGPAVATHVVRDARAGWQAFAPGIQRRVLWQDGPLAAMLYLTEPGACVPHHGHGHDEECLSVRGDVFADDVLLTEGDFQLAPAGTEHRRVSTDTGGIVYLHGDIDLAVK